jgi:hypothetical protein
MEEARKKFEKIYTEGCTAFEASKALEQRAGQYILMQTSNAWLWFLEGYNAAKG